MHLERKGVIWKSAMHIEFHTRPIEAAFINYVLMWYTLASQIGWSPLSRLATCILYVSIVLIICFVFHAHVHSAQQQTMGHYQQSLLASRALLRFLCRATSCENDIAWAKKKQRMFYEHKHCKATESASHNCIYGSNVFHQITSRTRRFCPSGILKMVARCGCAVPRACWTQLIDKEEVGIPEPVAKDVNKREAEGWVAWAASQTLRAIS